MIQRLWCFLWLCLLNLSVYVNNSVFWPNEQEHMNNLLVYYWPWRQSSSRNSKHPAWIHTYSTVCHFWVGTVLLLRCNCNYYFAKVIYIIKTLWHEVCFVSCWFIYFTNLLFSINLKFPKFWTQVLKISMSWNVVLGWDRKL